VKRLSCLLVTLRSHFMYVLDIFFKICQTISSLLGKEYFPAASLFIEADTFDDDSLSTIDIIQVSMVQYVVWS
jgi:hypothetical protein